MNCCSLFMDLGNRYAFPFHFCLRSIPPLIISEAPPNVAALPDAGGVYVVPGMTLDLFSWNGFWRRPWEGRWYRSPYYDHGRAYYNGVPTFYFNVDPFGKHTTKTIVGTVTFGIINRFPIRKFSRTGRVGRAAIIGIRKRLGVFRVIL
ncbi:MAG TPA: hypothetical protein VFG29_13365 [Syntrophales bacterium]|nr:hypothetical protein [Syntrophales bacterium]